MTSVMVMESGLFLRIFGYHFYRIHYLTGCFFSLCYSLIIPLRIIDKKINDNIKSLGSLKLFQISTSLIVLICTIFLYFGYKQFDKLYQHETPSLLYQLSVVMIILLLIYGCVEKVINQYSYRFISGTILLGLYNMFIVTRSYEIKKGIDYYIFFALVVTISLYLGIAIYLKKENREKLKGLSIFSFIIAALMLTLDILNYKCYYTYSITAFVIASINLLGFLKIWTSIRKQ